MPIDPFSDDILTLTQAARRLPRLRAGRPVAVSTIWRWATHGLRGVTLETAMCGGVRITSTECLRRFFAALGSKEHSSNNASTGNQAAIERRLDELNL